MRWNLDRAPEALMDAAVDPARWIDALTDIAHATSSLGAVMFSADAALGRPPCSPRLDRVVDDYALGGWNVADVRFEVAPLLDRRGVVCERDFLAPERIAADAFYQDFLLPHDLHWFAGVGFLLHGAPWCVSFQRSAAQGPFQRDELADLRRLLRPLADAATVAGLVDEVRLATTVDALQLVPKAALVCDRSGRVLTMNAAAESLVGALYDAASRTLRFASPSASDGWALLLRQALDPSAIESSALASHPGVAREALVLDAHGDPLVMRAVVLSGSSRLLFVDGAAVLVLVEPRKPPLGEILARRYRLTPGQIGVAEALLAGVSLDDIARARGVKVASARAQLKAIYARTDTRNQAHLVALLHGLAARP